MNYLFAKIYLRCLMFVCVLLFLSSTALSFGFFAHRTINRMAVFGLPPEMVGLYKHHIEFISERSIDPDKRAHAVPGEAQRHYIDIDHFGPEPFDQMPRLWKDAVEKFSEDTLQKYGVLPWHIDVMMRRLQHAFVEQDTDRIILLSAHLGHYIADACTPLHTTKFYNGRTPEERGIHALWESRLPELFSSSYSFFTGRAEYIANPLDRVWELIEISHLKVDTIYLIYDSLMIHFPRDLRYAHEMRGQAFTRVFSRDFSQAFHEAMDHMVERQMRLATKAMADFWFTAWVNAGQPDFQTMQRKSISQKMMRLLRKEEETWSKAKEPASRYEPE